MPAACPTRCDGVAFPTAPLSFPLPFPFQAGQGRRAVEAAEGDTEAGDGLQTLGGEAAAAAWEALQRQAQQHEREKQARERRAAVQGYEAFKEERRERKEERQEFLQTFQKHHGRQARVLPPELREKAVRAAPRGKLLVGVTRKPASKPVDER